MPPYSRSKEGQSEGGYLGRGLALASYSGGRVAGKKVATRPNQARGNKTLERFLDQKKLVQEMQPKWW